MQQPDIPVISEDLLNLNLSHRKWKCVILKYSVSTTLLQICTSMWSPAHLLVVETHIRCRSLNVDVPPYIAETPGTQGVKTYGEGSTWNRKNPGLKGAWYDKRQTREGLYRHSHKNDQCLMKIIITSLCRGRKWKVGSLSETDSHLKRHSTTLGWFSLKAAHCKGWWSPQIAMTITFNVNASFRECAKLNSNRPSWEKSED